MAVKMTHTRKAIGSVFTFKWATGVMHFLCVLSDIVETAATVITARFAAKDIWRPVNSVNMISQTVSVLCGFVAVGAAEIGVICMKIFNVGSATVLFFKSHETQVALIFTIGVVISLMT